MGKYAINNELNKILSLCLVAISLSVSLIAFGNILRDKRITELEKQVNNLIFEKEYLEFVERDNKEQSK